MNSAWFVDLVKDTLSDEITARNMFFDLVLCIQEVEEKLRKETEESKKIHFQTENDTTVVKFLDKKYAYLLMNVKYQYMSI